MSTAEWTRLYRQIVHPWQAWIYWNLWLADGAPDTGAVALLRVQAP